MKILLQGSTADWDLPKIPSILVLSSVMTTPLV